MERIQKWISKAKDYIQNMSFSGGAMRYIVFYAVLLMACCLLYIGGWAVMWYIDGRPNLKEMLSFLHEIAGASWVAVVGFVAKALVDKNNNGIPDEYEQDEKEVEQNDERRISERSRSWSR